MATKLHQVIPARDEQAKVTAQRLTELHHTLKNSGKSVGRRRTYEPVNDEGIRYPDESQKVEIRAIDAIATARVEFARLIDVTATRDEGNMNARADVVVDGQTLLSGVPATTLLWLEKQMDDLLTFVSKLPVLPADTNWTWDDGERVNVSTPVVSLKTTKVTQVLTLAPATERHPAQATTQVVDEIEGRWTTVNLSGALAPAEVRTLVDRVTKVRGAVKAARSDANETTVEQKNLGAAILGYVFA